MEPELANNLFLDVDDSDDDKYSIGLLFRNVSKLREKVSFLVAHPNAHPYLGLFSDAWFSL